MLIIIPKEVRVTQLYIICPVRHLDGELRQRILKYAADLERQGYSVRVPFEHTDQDDPIGIRITDEHEWKDILKANEFRVIWVADSEGSWWDWAQARVLNYVEHERRIFFLDPQTMKPLAEELQPQPPILASEDDLWQKAQEPILCLTWNARADGMISRTCLWQLAQARIIARLLNLSVCFCNAREIRPTPIKSYNNVALATHLNLPPDVSREDFDRTVAALKEQRS